MEISEIKHGKSFTVTCPSCNLGTIEAPVKEPLLSTTTLTGLHCSNDECASTFTVKFEFGKKAVMAKLAPIILRLTKEELEEIASWASMMDSEWGRTEGPEQVIFDRLREKINKLADEYEVKHYL